jgi:two-component system alkaline phosphatase synthesis response regulator PhoP
MSPVTLVVDEDAAVRSHIRDTLMKVGLGVLSAASGKDAVTMLETAEIDLLVVNRMLPDIHSFELCRRFRERSRAPVMFLAGRPSDMDWVRALSVGADDLVTKPFNTAEFLARVQVHLRRWSWLKEAQAQLQEGDLLTIGPLQLDTGGHRALLRGCDVHLTPMEFNLLRVLAKAPGRVLPREQLLALATGQEVAGRARTVDVHVRSLRLKLEDDPARPQLLESIRGAGYCLGRRFSEHPEEELA